MIPIGGPPIPDRRRQLDAIHPPRHVDVGENDADVGSALQHRDGRRGVGSLQHHEARVFGEIDRRDAEEWFVFDDEDNGPGLGHVLGSSQLGQWGAEIGLEA